MWRPYVKLGRNECFRRWITSQKLIVDKNDAAYGPGGNRQESERDTNDDIDRGESLLDFAAHRRSIGIGRVSVRVGVRVGQESSPGMSVEALSRLRWLRASGTLRV